MIKFTFNWSKGVARSEAILQRLNMDLEEWHERARFKNTVDMDGGY